MQQIDQMLEDRSDMSGVFAGNHPIVTWAAIRFERGDQGRRVFWDYSEPLSRQPAEHLRPVEHLRPAGDCLMAIRISNDVETTGLDKWAMLVFEFHNIELAVERDKLENRLVKDALALETFAIECVKTEHTAMLKTIRFLDKHKIRPLVTESDRITKMIFETSDSFEEDQKRFKRGAADQYDPIQFFAEYGRELLKYEKSKEQ